jgi:hypothetical protein
MMNIKTIAQSVLLLFAAAGVGFWVWGKIANDPAGEPLEPLPNAAEVEPSGGPVVRVTYFTDDIKCESCRTIEALTRQTVAERYPEQLKTGRVFYEKRNMDNPRNAGLVRDYGLSFKTVVIADVRDGEVRGWERMDDVWNRLHQEEKFVEYLAGQIEETLGQQRNGGERSAVTTWGLRGS